MQTLFHVFHSVSRATTHNLKITTKLLGEISKEVIKYTMSSRSLFSKLLLVTTFLTEILLVHIFANENIGFQIFAHWQDNTLLVLINEASESRFWISIQLILVSKANLIIKINKV